MENENEVVVPAEEVTPEAVVPEDAKPVGEATIVEMETPAEQFPEHPEA